MAKVRPSLDPARGRSACRRSTRRRRPWRRSTRRTRRRRRRRRRWKAARATGSARRRRRPGEEAPSRLPSPPLPMDRSKASARGMASACAASTTWVRAASARATPARASGCPIGPSSAAQSPRAAAPQRPARRRWRVGALRAPPMPLPSRRPRPPACPRWRLLWRPRGGPRGVRRGAAAGACPRRSWSCRPTSSALASTCTGCTRARGLPAA